MQAADLTLHYNAVDILERNLPALADKVALYSSQREMTFRQISEEVNQTGHALKALGVRFGEYVGILAFDEPEWVTTFFGTVKIGAIAVGLKLLRHPAVLECAVIGCPDQNNLIKPKAFVVLKSDAAPSNELAQALIEHCLEHMASYKRPRWVEFVSALPKTATGKIQRYKLRQAVAEGHRAAIGLHHE